MMLGLKDKVKKWFFEAVALDPEIPGELKEVLKRGHPNLDNFLNNMAGQLIEADKRSMQRGLVLKEKTLQDFTYDMAKYFCRGMEGQAKARYESDLAKAAREAEKAKQAEFDNFLSGGEDNEFFDSGVIQDEIGEIQRQKALESAGSSGLT